MGTTPWSGRDYVQADANNPAVYVSWGDAQAFIAKLNQAAGSELYRLPTEAEWEYACRAGTTTRWPFGDDESKLKDYAWYNKNAWDVGEKYAHGVGTKLPNPWGLFNMLANVYEWCLDRRGSYSSDAVVDPLNLVGSGRVARGGSFRGDQFGPRARHSRSAGREYWSPGFRYHYVGFRLLRMAQ